MPATPAQLATRAEKLCLTDRKQVAFFTRRKKNAVKNVRRIIEKILNSPFQISLQEKKSEKKIFAAAIKLDRFLEWC